MLNIFFCYMLFASGIFVNKLILFKLSPSMLSGIRMLISGLIILVANWRSYRDGALQKIMDHWQIFLAITLFTNFIPTLCKAYAIKNLISSKAAFIGSLDPFVTAFYAYLIYSESLTLKKWVGILFGFIGTLLLISTSSPVEASLGSFLMVSLPELAAIASVAISRLGWILVQKQMRTNTFSAVDINGVVMTGGGLFAFMLIPFWNLLGLSNESFNISGALNSTILVKGTSIHIGFLLFYTVIIGNLIAYNLYAHLLKHNSATLMSLAGFTIPIYVSLMGYFLLGEPVTWMLVVAAVCMLVGVGMFYFDDVLRDFLKKKQLGGV